MSTTTTRRDVTRFAAVLAGELSFIVPAATNGVGDVIVPAHIGRVTDFTFDDRDGRTYVTVDGTMAGRREAREYIFGNDDDLLDWATRIVHI